MSKGGRIFILTSCTGEKGVEDPSHLTLADFRKGPVHIRERERVLKDKLTPAENLYSGMQHARLMRGIQVARNARIDVDFKIVSAGYGVVEPDRKIAPYEATFIGMGKAALHQWARQLGIPGNVWSALAAPNDLALVLLGEDYLTACELCDKLKLGGPTLVLCGKASAAKLPKLPNLHPVLLSNADTKRFSCGLVGLKGEVAARLLEVIAAEPKKLAAFVSNPQGAVDNLATPNGNTSAKGSRPQTRANVRVDRVIEIPQTWWDKPHRRKLRYFIPEWDDLVDPDYDFAADTHSGGTGDWSNEVYAHQMYNDPNYDGILISKVVAEKSKKKKERINRLGVHRFLRVPREFPIMGDCGAFGYINEKVPPYTTDEILDYYTRLDFDLGVSIDHLIVTATESEKGALRLDH